MTSLTTFLGLETPSPPLALCMSRFDRASIDPAHNPPGLTYPSYALAERDVRSANHVQRLAIQAGADVAYVTPDELASQIQAQSWGSLPSTVLFGSRSNAASMDFLRHSPIGQLVSFEFAETWTIRTRDDKTYSVLDPSHLSREEYAASIDYGIVGRAAVSGRSHFIIAGLGGRATEGCGLYLQRNWESLAAQAQHKTFVAVLRFKPPVDPANHELVEFITSH